MQFQPNIDIFSGKQQQANVPDSEKVPLDYNELRSQMYAKAQQLIASAMSQLQLSATVSQKEAIRDINAYIDSTCASLASSNMPLTVALGIISSQLPMIVLREVEEAKHIQDINNGKYDQDAVLFQQNSLVMEANQTNAWLDSVWSSFPSNLYAQPFQYFEAKMGIALTPLLAMAEKQFLDPGLAIRSYSNAEVNLLKTREAHINADDAQNLILSVFGALNEDAGRQAAAYLAEHKPFSDLKNRHPHMPTHVYATDITSTTRQIAQKVAISMLTDPTTTNDDAARFLATYAENIVANHVLHAQKHANGEQRFDHDPSACLLVRDATEGEVYRRVSKSLGQLNLQHKLINERQVDQTRLDVLLAEHSHVTCGLCSKDILSTPYLSANSVVAELAALDFAKRHAAMESKEEQLAIAQGIWDMLASSQSQTLAAALNNRSQALGLEAQVGSDVYLEQRLTTLAAEAQQLHADIGMHVNEIAAQRIDPNRQQGMMLSQTTFQA